MSWLLEAVVVLVLASEGYVFAWQALVVSVGPTLHAKVLETMFVAAK